MLMVSGWWLCDYWLPHESLDFWDAEPVPAAKGEESSSAPGAGGTPARGEGEREALAALGEEQTASAPT